MTPITRSEILGVISENPMICTRSIIKRLRPEAMSDPAAYQEELHAV
ncbi:MAG: hypothetical protein IJ856_04435 [Candidatus Methanomethylophilaceae archaeon]|nr:hypothetical protein [Candidatus Methanomethylophilaceae archaeon]